MQYRTYKFKQLDNPYTWNYTKTDGTTATLYNYDTLVFASGGAVIDYDIDNDYMINNNSTISIASETKAVAGQIIALIDNAGAYDLGVISSVDNEKLQILYKSMMEIFNNDFLNPGRSSSNEETEITYKYDAVIQTGQIIASYYCTTVTDKFLRLPLFIRYSGGGTTAIWTYNDITFNIKDWLIDLFDTHNIVVQFKLVFEVTERAYIEVYIKHNTTETKRLFKSNMHDLTIKQSEQSATQYNVCQVIEQETKELLATYYLRLDNTITNNSSDEQRMQPYKLTTAEFDSQNSEGVTTKDVAEDTLLYSEFNHYINLTISKNSQMLPKNMEIGDPALIVPELEEMTASSQIENNYSDKVFNSIYTGRKETNKTSEITFIFGKIRVNYTDIIQMKNMKKLRS